MLKEYSEIHSKKALLKILLGLVMIAGVILYYHDFINHVYFKDQQTATGLIVNGVIIALFLAGLLRMVQVLFFYNRQEKAIADFVENLDAGLKNPLAGVNEQSFIARRYQQLQHLHQAHSPINHGALASMLVAEESTRTNSAKYINNILVLMGVFGTIVSLSIALLGASNLLKAEDLDAMNMVIHGMSTAMTTTITAIVCYLLYGYFYMMMTNVQTKIISVVEMITATSLIPRFNRQMDSVVQDVADLVYALREVATNMQRSQRNTMQMEQRLGDLVQHHDTHLGNISKELGRVTRLLQAGFRLPEQEQ